MSNIRLLALDLDGTALQPDNTISPVTADAVRRARAAGIYVAVATGRICSEAQEFARALGADDQMVTAGGATLSSVQYGVCTMRLSMPWEPAMRAAAIVERIGLTVMVYAGETLLLTPYDDLAFSRYKTNEGYLAAKQVVPSIAAYIGEQHLSIDKIFVRAQDPLLLRMARAHLAKIPGVRVMSSAADNLEILSPLADKGIALDMLCRSLGTDLAHCAAIGDSENDTEMLLAVGLPIAMGNADEAIKRLCRYTTETNAAHGVAAAIDQILSGQFQ